MKDEKIIELFFARDENAIKETEKKYGALCHHIAENFLCIHEDREECVSDSLLELWNSITTAKEQKLYLDKADADLMRGKKILIVDDVISTGESLLAIEKLVNAAGGNICGRMAILAEGNATRRKDLIYLEKLPLFDKEGEPIA